MDQVKRSKTNTSFPSLEKAGAYSRTTVLIGLPSLVRTSKGIWIGTLYQEWHDVEIEADDVALILR